MPPPSRSARWAAALDARWAARGHAHRRRHAPATRDVRWIPVRTAIVRARVTGSGPGRPIVIVPDPPNTIEHYGSLIELLAPGGLVICLDPPGFSFSSPQSGFAFGLDEQAGLIGEVLDAIGARDVTLSAGCLGGFSAVRLAGQRPDLVARLALVQLPSAEEALRWVRAGYWWLLGTPLLGQLAVALGRRTIVRQWYNACLGAATPVNDLLAPGLDMLTRGGSFCLASGFQMFRPDLLHWLRPRQPARIVWGGADRTHVLTDPRSGLALLPDAEWERWDCGHYPDVERPAAYAHVLRG